MENNSSANDRCISLLSKLTVQGYNHDFSAIASNLDHLQPDLEQVASLGPQQLGEFLELADAHHVTVRALAVLEQMAAAQDLSELEQACSDAIATEQARISKAVEGLYAIVQALDMAGCPVTVIKSLDHWPDLGSDLDLYTSGSPEQVVKVMKERMQAELEPRSWGDRLAGKWNFQIPGLNELVEIHVRYLGQTGEQTVMARRVLERGVTKTVNGRRFPVPAPEERILISTLQRMYRHFYFRLCDMVDMAKLLMGGAVDFVELRRGAEKGGIWPGVASYLVILSNYLGEFGRRVELPREVIRSASSADLQVQFRGGFLRVPMRPAAGLYGSQLLNASRHRDLRAIARLPLLPPLAVSALLAYRLTGSDKGVW